MQKYINILVSSFLVSCGVYSFDGASIPSNAKSFYVSNFIIKTDNCPANTGNVSSEKLIDLLLNQTSLQFSNKETELNFYGEIINYKINPISIQSNDIAAKNRLEITIKVKYINTLDNNQNFEHSFKRYRDFDSEQNLTEIEDDLIQSILEEITEDIYNKAFVNW